MYKTEDFLNRYRELEEWANGKYGYDCLKRVEDTFYNVNIQKEIRYFKNVRNVLSHNCNNNDDPYIVLTEAFKDRFEKLCWYLMDNVSQIYVPYNQIYKRQMNDRIFPTISIMKKKCYSYVPIMNNRKVWGVFSEVAVFDIVGDGKATAISDDMQLMEMSQYITKYSREGSFDFAGEDATIDDIRNFFIDEIGKGRRLDVIFITTTGDMHGDLLGLVTIWDITSL